MRAGINDQEFAGDVAGAGEEEDRRLGHLLGRAGLQDAGAVMIITADEQLRGGKQLPLYISKVFDATGSASSITARAMRSLTEPSGLKDSTFA